MTSFVFFLVLLAAFLHAGWNSFSGGTVAATLNGSNASTARIGTVASQSSTGGFYGWDDTLGAPDEVGGVGYIVGDNGGYQFSFIAD